MSQIAYFNLPDVGEGLTEAEIVTWKVAVGDNVSVNQIIVEIETAKSLVELPVPFAGVVSELLAKEGDTVEVGKPIIGVKVEGSIGEVSTATNAIKIIDEILERAYLDEDFPPDFLEWLDNELRSNCNNSTGCYRCCCGCRCHSPTAGKPSNRTSQHCSNGSR